jgi:hypothetical protein
MSEPSIATSADYADALIVARRAKHWLFLILLLVLLVHLSLFFVARYTTFFPSASATAPTTQPARAMEEFHYLTGVTTFLGTILPPLLALVLLIIVNIMLVGRLIGVARVTSAYIWSLLLMLLLFPWQAFLGKVTFYSGDFRIPGVLFTWEELVAQAHFPTQPLELAIVKWARFLVFPLLALILLMMVQSKSNRGLRQALGESTPDGIA